MKQEEYNSLYDRVFDIYKDAMEHLDIIDRTDNMKIIRLTALELKENISDLLYALEAKVPEDKGDE